MKSMRSNTIFLISVFLICLTGHSLADGSFKVKDNLRTGGSLRLRHESWRNIFDLENRTKDDRYYFRFRGSLWAGLDFTEDINLFAKLTDESKAYAYYYVTSKAKSTSYVNVSEIVFDSLYLDISNLLGAPIDLRLGRQDFLGTYGEGFLIMDGTPLDGSRTYYFNALKASYRINDSNTLDFVYINNPKEEIFLPILNDTEPNQQLNASDEEAAFVYWKGKPLKDLDTEAYYIFKNEESKGPRLQAHETDLNTVGYFIRYNRDTLTLRNQLACQFGEYGSDDRSGLGGYIFLDNEFKNVALSPKMTGGFIYLSGDDPATTDNEAWDPLFSRWPWMSDLYSMTYAGESGMDYWTNLLMWRARAELNPTDKMKISSFYNFMKADENVTGALFGNGTTRGHLPQVRLDYSFNRNITSYVLAEYFIPEDFYRDGSDGALFLRTELQFKF
ncbi:MAG: alginate export family protein [Candidatus Omnitrophica bacterium]|nr:alginate export family protein [Candidatus Omnitrophota bacterium]